MAASSSAAAMLSQIMWKRYQILFAALCWAAVSSPAEDLSASFDARGITHLSYRGTSLIDLAAGRGDGFLVGTYQLAGKSAWGGVGNHVTWDAPAQRLTWSWAWGRVECVYRLDAPKNTLQLSLLVVNNSRDELQAIDIYPLGLQFPKLPANFGAPNYPQFRNALDGPPVLVADYGTATLTLLHLEPTPANFGLTPSGPANHYQLRLGTVTDAALGFLGKALPVHRPVPAGKSDSYTVELRFAAPGAGITQTAGDALRAYGKAFPMTMRWTDRRPIGELFLSDPVQKARSDTHPNPRSYSFFSKADIHSPDGKAQFRQALLAYADRSIANLKKAGAQGAIVWDLEGQQFPQPDTSYIGDPTLLLKLAPEMDAVADDFFRKFSDAGLRCGLTIRPQHLDLQAKPPVQQEVGREAEGASLIAKIGYALERWHCTLFYVDSDGGPNDATSPDTLAAVSRRFPNVLIIPENIWPRDYAYAAPLASFTAPYKPLHTPAWIQAIWPQAFSVTYVGDAPGHSIKATPDLWSAFQNARTRGDVLAFRAWFDDQPLNSQIAR